MKFNELLKEVLQPFSDSLEGVAFFLNVETEYLEKYQENEPIPINTLSDILEKLALKIVESEQNHYMIVPKTLEVSDSKKEFFNFNGVLKNIRKNAKINQTEFGRIFDKNLLLISRYELGTTNFKTDFLESVMKKMNATIKVDVGRLNKHFKDMQQHVPFTERLVDWNVRQTGGYNYLLDGLVFSKKLKKNILVSVSPESICIFKTPRKGLLNCTSLPSKEAFLKEYNLVDGSGELAKMEVVLACLNRNEQIEKTSHFNSFFDEEEFEFLSYISKNMNEIIHI